jgi:hypothetical protein
MGLKSRLMDVLITDAYLPEAKREIKMRVKIRVLKLIKRVVHTRKRVSVLTRNLVEATVVNSQT